LQILISSVGTRGDVQPVLALALAMRRHGHQVRLCIPPNFLDWAHQLGLPARPLGIAMRPGPIPDPMPDLIRDQFDTLEDAARDCDLLIGAGTHQYAARSIAQLNRLRCLIAVYAPQHYQNRALWNERSLERVNQNRSRLGLPAISDVLDHILGENPWLAADPILAPEGKGAWLLPDHSPLSPDLEHFLEQGPPPVYLGLGSMPAAPGTAAKLLAAAHGQRCILSRGWAGLEADGAPDCLEIDDCNQQKLFPRLAAVVHHGGAGTTHTAAQAGVPQLVFPMFSDQFYWGERVQQLGLGESASLEQLPDALQRVLGQPRPQPIDCSNGADRLLQELSR